MSDSARLRTRIGAYAKNKLSNYGAACWHALEERLAADNNGSYYHTRVAGFFNEADFRDFADGITVIFDAIGENYRKSGSSLSRTEAKKWREFCAAAFTEENSSYFVDERAVVRPIIDTEFNNVLISTVAGMEGEKYSAVRHEIENAIEAIQALKLDPKTAIRSIFEAIEIYAKLEFPRSVRRLNKNAVLQVIKPQILASEIDAPGRETVSHICDALVDWIDACHIYRHGQEVEKPTPPSTKNTVAIVSAGLTHLRWMRSSLSGGAT